MTATFAWDTRFVMKLAKSRNDVRHALDLQIRAGTDLVAKQEIANDTGGYADWLNLFGTWREDTAMTLAMVFVDRVEKAEFLAVSTTAEYSSARSGFASAKAALGLALFWLDRLTGRLELAVGIPHDAVALASLHPEIHAKCRSLYNAGEYSEAVEKGFKVVRDRLRALTGYETGSDAFGRGNLHVAGAVAPHVNDEFQHGVQFLTMAIDRFRNEKVHTSDADIDDPIRAYEYLRLSSLAMHLLDEVRSVP